MKVRFFYWSNVMSKAFTVCVVLFALLAYAGIYHLVVSNVPVGRLLLEVSMVPAAAAIAFEVMAMLVNRRLERRRPVILR